MKTKSFFIKEGTLLKTKNHISCFKQIDSYRMFETNFIHIKKDEILFYIGNKYEKQLFVTFMKFIWKEKIVYLPYGYMKTNFRYLFNEIKIKNIIQV